MYVLPHCANFSDSGLATVQRIFADLPEPTASRRKTARNRRQMAIFNGERTRAHLRRAGLSAEDLGKRLRIWRLEELLDYGEADVRKARRIADALGVPLDDLVSGWRTP